MTFTDFARSRDPDGKQAQVYELMQQVLPCIEDAPAYPSNDLVGERVTYRRVLPSVGTAKINKGVARSKSATDQRVDSIGFWAGRSEVDRRLKDIWSGAAYVAKRKSEDRAFEEALAQEVANAMFYGDIRTDEASFDGLATRMGTLNPGTSRTTSQVWSHADNPAGAGQAVVGSDGCSIYVVDWSEDTCHLIYPQNAEGGLMMRDLLDQPALDLDGLPFQADVSTYDWYVGVTVKDPRHIARLANIDLSDSRLDTPLQGKIIDSLERMLSYMPPKAGANRVLYCPIGLLSGFQKQARSFSNQALTIRDYLGKPEVHFWDNPIRAVEQLSITESTVS